MSSLINQLNNSNLFKMNKINPFITSFFLFIIISLYPSTSSSKSKISHINILLPICPSHNCEPVHTKIVSDDGCFDWYVDRPDLIKIDKKRKRAEQPNCYGKAMLTNLAYTTQENAYITAKDKSSEMSFSCKVGFGEIHSISIEKRFDQMNVGEISELQVIAKDQYDNSFTSLEGWEFHWEISNKKAELLHMKSLNKKIGSYREAIEQKGKYSDIISIKALKVGEIVISVRIVRPQMEHIYANTTMYIAEPFEIIPKGPIYMDRNTFVDLKIRHIHSNRIVTEDEYEYYKWYVDDIDCLSISDNMFGHFESGSSVCSVNVTASDNRVSRYNNDTVLIKVVIPNEVLALYKEIPFEYREMELHEIDNNDNILRNEYEWKLVENKYYFMKMYLAYNNHQIIFNRHKEIFRLDYNTLQQYIEYEMIECNDRTHDICKFHTTSITEDKKKLTVSALGTINTDKDIRIYEQIVINKFGRNKFILPYINGITGQELNLIIKGGTGKYKVKSSDYGIVDVDIKTNILNSRKEGNANVIVIDEEIPENKDDVDIEVRKVMTISHYEERQEIPLNEIFNITPLAYHDMNGNNKYNVDSLFTNCTDLLLDYNHNINKDKIEYIEHSEDEDISSFSKVRMYIYTNLNDIISTKISLHNISINDNEYLNYSNYGICNIFNYKAINEGYVTINTNTYSYHNLIPSQIYIYTPLSIEQTITDNYTQSVITKGGIIHPDTDKTYLIPEHKIMTLHFIGGIKQWQNPLSKYYHNILYFDMDMQPLSSLNGINIINNTKQVTSLQFKGIKEKSEYIIRYYIVNERDTKLLKPASVYIEFKIGCYNPHDLAIHILSQASITKSMFDIYQQKGIDYYIKSNSTEIIRVYAFDTQRRMLSIMDSINKVFNTKTSKVSSDYFKEVNNNERHLYGITKQYEQSREFMQGIIYFKGIESVFDLNVETENFWGQHHANIHLIGLPSITPSNGTIYVYDPKPFELTIKGGSGYYEVLPTNEYIAEVEYDTSSNKIYVKPIKMGTLVINVKDTFLSSFINGNIISSTINIVDIQNIRLIGGGPVMMNNYINIDIEVYNNLNEKFSIETQSKLPLSIPMNKFNNHLYISFANPNTQTQLKVEPILKGKYSIFITYDRTGLRSDEVEIEVFEQLDIFPPYLLLVPGSSFTLSINGGPKDENAKLTYKIIDTNIANVSSDEPLVTANEIGETQLEIQLLYKSYDNKVYNKEEEKDELNKHTILSIQYVNVTVALPHKGEILNANQREIITGSTIRLLALIKSSSDELFTYGLGLFKFIWTIDNKHIAKIKYVSKQETIDELSSGPEFKCDSDNTEECTLTIDNDEDLQPENSVGIFLQSIQKGMVTISLTIEIEYPRKYNGSKYGIFYTKSNVIINDETFANIPTFYQQQDKITGLYMVPFNITHKLHTNQQTQQLYKILNNESNDILNLSSNGVINTFNKEGLVSIQIIDYSKEKTLPTTLPVYVSDFRAIFVEKSSNLIDLQMNQEIHLKINIQHDSGISFANNNLDGLQLRSIESHPRIATATLIESNSIIVIKTEKIGSTNIILLNPHSRKIYDVFRINVNKEITSLKKIFLNINGSIKLLDKSPERKSQYEGSSEWRSTNNEVVSVNYNGEVIGKKEGNAIVQLVNKKKGTKHISLQIEVRNIYTINKNIFPKRITNVKTSPEYKERIEIPIEYLSEKGEKMTLDNEDEYNMVDQKIKGSCKVNENACFVGEMIKKGKDNVCVLIPREVRYMEVGKGKELEVVMKMEGKVKGEIKEKIIMDCGFGVKDDIKEVKLTYKKMKDIIYIDSFDNVNVEISDESKVKVNKREDKKCLEIYVANEDIDDFSFVEIILKNEITKQKHIINVSYKNISGNTLFFGLIKQETFYDFLTFVMLIASILVLCYYMTETDKSQHNEQQNPSQYSSSQTPERYYHYGANFHTDIK